MGFYFSPDDVAKYWPWFHSLPIWSQLVIVMGVALLLGGLVGWRSGKGFYANRIAGLNEQIEGFRDRFQGKTPEEALTQIKELQTTVELLQQAQWRKLKAEQVKSFIDNLSTPQAKQALKDGFLGFIYMFSDPEAESYAKQLHGMLREIGIRTHVENLVSNERMTVLREQRGLVVLVKDENALTENEQWLVSGFRWAGIQHTVSSCGASTAAMSPQYLGLWVGPKPE